MAIAPQRLGAVLGLLAALSFGVSAPLSKRLLSEISPQLLAGLLYLGAGVGLVLYRLARPSTREAALTRSDLPPLLGVVALGGVAGPPRGRDHSSCQKAIMWPSSTTRGTRQRVYTGRAWETRRQTRGRAPPTFPRGSAA